MCDSEGAAEHPRAQVTEKEALLDWRRGWDSNPRYGFPYARFRGEYFQPLSHLSAVVAELIVAERCVFRQSGRGHYRTLWQCVGKYRAESMQCCWTAGASRKSRMHRLKRVSLAARCEERLDDGCTFGGEDARSDFHLMIKARVGEDFEARADGAAFGIVGAVDETRDTGLEDCA